MACYVLVLVVKQIYNLRFRSTVTVCTTDDAVFGKLITI